MTPGTLLARRYARAVFGLGEEAQARTRLLEEVDTLTQQIEASDELRRVLFTPLHPRRERRGVVRELSEQLMLSPEVRSFAMLLVDENRTQHLPAIRDELRRMVDRAAGRLTAEVTSARPLDEAELDELRRALARRVDAEVTLETRVDPALIGGVVARVGNLLLDGSLRTQLDALGAQLRKG